MQQLAIVHTEQISRKGEIKYFQIPLTGTQKKIIAVEVSAFLFTQVVEVAVITKDDPLFFIARNEKIGLLSLQSPDATDIFYQCEAYREDKNIGYGDFSFKGIASAEWLKGKRRLAPEVLITTESPILEAYYRDAWGDYYNRDISYQLNIIIWYEKKNL